MGRFRDIELDELELHSERLVLRRWRADDAKRVFEVASSGALHRYLPLPDPYTREDAQYFVDEIGHEGRGDGTGLGCAVVERGSGQVVGAAALRIGDDGEIGYWIAPEAQGRGYAAEATRALAAFGHAHGLHRIRLDCDVSNVASIGTALHSGFAFEGVVRGMRLPGRHEPGDVARFARVESDADIAIMRSFPALPRDGLSDGVLALRVTRADDAPGLLANEDAEATRWSFDGARPAPERITCAAAEAALMWQVGAAAQLTMVDVATGRFAGGLTLRKAGPPLIGGIGYGVHPAFRGRGYTARALRLISAFAFDIAQFARLELGAKPGNLASQRAAISGGFVADGIRVARLRNADGSFDDEIRFALINPRVR